MQTGLHRNTISKVYRQLETDGVVEAMAGSGIYVRDQQKPREIRTPMNSILGFSGNLLTILAIPYAAKKKKFNLHRNWPLTIFILNLAIADFLYSSINLPLYALQY